MTVIGASSLTSRTTRIIAVALVMLSALSTPGCAQSKQSDARFDHSLKLHRLLWQSTSARLALHQYLLSGDTRESDRIGELNKEIEQQVKDLRKTNLPSRVQSGLLEFQDLEARWTREVAQPLIEKRRTLDAGRGTLADLQIRYLQSDPSYWKGLFDDAEFKIFGALEQSATD